MTKIKAIAKVLVNVTASGEDSDAATFLDAASILDTTQRSAIDTLVKELKSKNIWERLIAVYPMIGGDAAKHSLNLINPGTFQITWVNGPTHSASGVDYNGLTQYGRTGVIIRGGRDAHIGAYLVEDVASSSQIDMGARDGASNDFIALQSRDSGLFRWLGSMNSVFTGFALTPDSLGLYIVNRGFGNPIEGYKNGVLSASGTTTLGDVPLEIWLGGYNEQGTLTSPSTRGAAFYSLGDGLTATQVLDYYNAVQAYQTALGRNV